MIARALVFLTALWLGVGASRAIDLRQRTESNTRQFVIYSEDVRLRQRVASFAEEVKTDVLQLLNAGDLWRGPIVITLARPTTQEMSQPPVRLRLVETLKPGLKVELTVLLGDDPAAVNLRKHLIRAVLLEYAYREPGVVGDQPYVEPPWWIVEGLVELGRRRDAGADGELFRRLVETNRLPPIEKFLVEKPDELGPTAMAVDRAMAMCLIQLLVEQPGGHEALGRLVRAWPKNSTDPMAALAQEFPTFRDGAPKLQKWWTVNLARFAASDRYQGLTPDETEEALAALLQFEVKNEKTGEKKAYNVSDFEEYLKLPASRALLATRHTELVALSTKANLLFGSVFADYEQALTLLSKGKKRGVRDLLTRAEGERRTVLQRTVQIADYLNWFEATQMKSRSSAFDDYLKTADQMTQDDMQHKGSVGLYLDEIEENFQP